MPSILPENMEKMNKRSSKHFLHIIAIAEIIAIVVSCIFFLMVCNLYFDHGFFDDSFISLRYVQHLVDGHGLVWNIGEPPVEGFTNLAWVLLLGAFRKSEGNALELIARQVGILMGIGTILVAWLATRSLLPQRCRKMACIVPIHLALSPLFCRHAINGMETMMTCFLFLTMALLWTVDDVRKQTKVYWIAFSFLTFLATLTRPDAILFGTAGSITLLLVMKRRGIKVARYFIYWSGSLVILLGALIIWKYIYFGSIIPLPAYMKLRIDKVLESKTLLNFVLGHWLGFIRVVAPLLLITLLAIAKGRLHGRRSVLPLCVGTGVYGIYFLSVLPIMSVHWRFLFPIYAPLAIFAAISICSFCYTKSNSTKATINMLQTKRALVLLFFVVYNVGNFPNIKLSSNEQYKGSVNYGMIGKALAGIPGISVAVSEVGQLPYYSRCRVLDLSGLNNRFIAKNRFNDPHFDETFKQYLITEFGLPDVYVSPPAEYNYAIIEAHPDILQHYIKIKVPKVQSSLYILKGSNFRNEILSSLQRLK